MVSAQERLHFSNDVVNYGNPNNQIWTQFMPYARGRVMEDIDPYITQRSPLLKESDYDKMLENIDKVTAQLRTSIYIGEPQGVDINIYKAIGHNYDTDTYNDYTKDPNAHLYGEITILVDPCIFYKGKRGNAQEMFAKLIIRINNSQIGYPEDVNSKPAQVKIDPEKVATFNDYDVYWLEDNVEYTVISNPKIPVFIPISKEDYWRACIKKYSNSNESGMDIIVDLYKEKLSKLPDEELRYFITNPQLIEDPNKIQLITISWPKISNNIPLRLYNGGKDGFDLRYYVLKQLYNDTKVWDEIIKMINN